MSQSQKAYIPDLTWARTIYHGVAVEDFPYSSEPGKYLAFIGRVAPEKGLDWALAVARASGIPLKVAARIENPQYFQEILGPYLHDLDIEYLGVLGEQEKRALLAHALALIAPIRWPEPFGLVFIEALACGTPVLACPMGAAPEIISDGETGFLRNTEEELVEAIGRLPQLSRARCRETALRRFHVGRMVEEYVEVNERARHGLP